MSRRRKNPSSGEEILLLAGAAGLLYWWWSSQSSSTTTAATTTSSTPTSTVISTGATATPVTTSTPTTMTSTPSTTSTGTSTTSSTSSSALSLMQQVQAAATAGGLNVTSGIYSADQWNYYVAQVISGFTPPAPESLFPALANTPSTTYPGSDASHDPVSFSTYWTALQPFLPAGLSGFGLGAFRRSGIYPYGGWHARGWAA